jgi:hypothetical protein
MPFPMRRNVADVAIIHKPIEALIAEAYSYINERELDGNNRSVRIDYWNLEAIGSWKDFPMGGRGAPWCAAFVSAMGRQALGYAWPVPLTGMVQTMVDWAKEKGVWYEKDPQRGDLFTIYYPDLSTPRYGHVGIVVTPKEGSLTAVEGNTNPGGSREGYGVFERQRVPTDRYGYIRWVRALNK